jgi:hypothetical protein
MSESEYDTEFSSIKQQIEAGEFDEWDSWEEFVSESTKDDVEDEDVDERLDFDRIKEEFGEGDS